MRYPARLALSAKSDAINELNVFNLVDISEVHIDDRLCRGTKLCLSHNLS